MHINDQLSATKQPSRTLFSNLLLLITVLFILSTGSDVFAKKNWKHKGKGFHNCTMTSKAALQACKNEAADDLWIAMGNCANLSETDARRECMQDARSIQIEDQKTCKIQFNARQEICIYLGEEPYDPDFLPTDFVDPVAIGNDIAPNPYWPLVEGTQWIYEGETDEGTEVITVTVTDITKEIQYPEDSGKFFKCREVRDTVKIDGVMIEDTKDWYAQDKDGNVWYFGEIALNYEDGEIVDVEGSWIAGVDNAKPGIVMPIDPQVDEMYRQEFFLGDAEDMALILSTDAGSVKVPAGTYEKDILQTEEWTPIDPEAVEYKYYAPGVGMVLEENPDTHEYVELIEMTPAP